MTKSVKDFCKDIQASYREARQRVNQVWSMIEDCEAESSRISSDRNLSPYGRTEAHKQNNGRKTEYYRRLDEVGETAKREFSRIREDCRAMFAGYYETDPDKLSPSALALINSGVLSDTELLKLGAEKYSDNPTMQRLIAAEAEKRAKELGYSPNNGGLDLHEFYRGVMENREPHLDALDSVIYWSSNALKPDRVWSAAYAAHYEENTSKVIEGAPAVSCTIGFDGKATYTTAD